MSTKTRPRRDHIITIVTLLFSNSFSLIHIRAKSSLIRVPILITSYSPIPVHARPFFRLFGKELGFGVEDGWGAKSFRTEAEMDGLVVAPLNDK